MSRDTLRIKTRKIPHALPVPASSSRVLLLFLLALALTACTDALHSDSENAGRQHAAEMREWLAASQVASRQAPPAQPVAADALEKLLSGQTHVIEYRRRVGDPMPYFVTYEYFRADGRYVFMDTRTRRNPDEYPDDRWRVAEGVLCIDTTSAGAQEHCYTLRQEAGGVIQYWIHKPGDVSNGLISSSVKIVRSGLQTPITLAP